MSKIWYYTLNGEQKGPVTAVELKQLATVGDLKPDDLVWKDGMAEWVTAKNLKGLFSAGSQTKSPPKTDTHAEEPISEASATEVEKVKGQIKNSQRNSEEEPEEDGNAFAGFDTKAKSRSRDREDSDYDQEEERPVRKKSRSRDEYEDETERDDYDDNLDDRGKKGRRVPHRGGLVLTLGIISLVSSLFCVGLVSVGCGIPAILIGKKDLASMRARKMDPSGEGNTKVGFILGIIGLIFGILELISICLYFIVWGAIFGAMAGAGAGLK